MQKQCFVLLIALTGTIAYGATNWKLPDPRLRIDQIHFLGSHNAFLSKEDGWNYAQQQWSVPKQLENGVRFFEMDLGMDGKRLAICHGTCAGMMKAGKSLSTLAGADSYITFKKAFSMVADWLKKPEHQKEIVIIAFDIGRDKKMGKNEIDNEISSLNDINSMILTPAEWNPDEHNGEWPTLQWMYDNKKQIILFNPQIGNSPKYTYYQWRYIGGTPPGNTDPVKSAVLRGQSQEAFTDENERKKIQRIFQLNHFADVSEDYAQQLVEVGAKILPGNKKLKKAKNSAKISDNKQSTIQKVIAECKKKNIMNGKDPNIIFLDWTNKFIDDNGLEMINRWNEGEVQRLLA